MKKPAITTGSAPKAIGPYRQMRNVAAVLEAAGCILAALPRGLLISVEAIAVRPE
jgi:hypothetical protein